MAYGMASLIGIYSYNRFFKGVGFKSMLVITSILCSILGSSQILLVTGFNKHLGIPDGAFCIASGFLV